ncbi:MAG: 5-formyltetrahydrofolate cyclo-ligase [Cryomorphaceae bacterium]
MNRRVQGRHCQRYAGDPTISSSESTLSKPQLRTKLRALRRSFSQRKQSEAASLTADHAQTLLQWHSAKKIAIYLNADGELRTGAIIQAALAQNKQIYLPVIGPKRSLSFAQWVVGQSLVPNTLGINEPNASASRCLIEALDILFLPLVAWDKRGNRLGMGGGYYDRALSGVSGPAIIGLAHSEQEVETVPRQSWDIVLDAVLTEQGIHHCLKEC